ncbi:MAG TPA: HEAT repeat domain-containing protein, partial [Polyangiaceae bacterium]|nr:HEAT repeat domain-containing protein [Polyangiaceae bacterium]
LGVADAQGALLAAARDPEPRVREAALQALAASSPQSAPPQAAVEVAESLLARDGWSFVRAQAVGVLAKAAAGAGVDEALGGALHDKAVAVRGAALVALGKRRAWSLRKAIRERLDDKDEDAEVRSAAARALGGVCDTGSAERLTELARGLGALGATEDDQQVALAALVGLAALQPRDLRDRLKPLLTPPAAPYVRAAAEQALAARGACQGDAAPVSR